MAYQFVFDLQETIRRSPVRAASAMVLLIAATLYVCVSHKGYRVAEIGEEPGADVIVDLMEETPWEDKVSLISSDDSDLNDAPAVVFRSGGRDQYVDARLTHAVAEEDESVQSPGGTVTTVSGEKVTRVAPQEPVWLLGFLAED